MTSKCLKIVLTGGPCGGKTTLMNELQNMDLDVNWTLVPEAAPLLFQAGIDRRKKSFQKAVIELQISLETISEKFSQDGSILICHRGTLDPLAYWLRNGWDENDFFAYTQMSLHEHHERYSGIIHLQSVAIGAEEHYLSWPNAHRTETIEQAKQTDYLCQHAWNKHPHYLLVDNTKRNWLEKSKIVKRLLIDLIKSKHNF
ncbi:hypothetical protein Lepto7375DRAFT_7466 [Leptolyngbya sp. PCC 7375]|nr:hypothetical protein Lepto7375DRAFT_7466 [Leptolyngbya sp. PCC 7375]